MERVIWKDDGCIGGACKPVAGHTHGAVAGKIVKYKAPNRNPDYFITAKEVCDAFGSRGHGY